MKISLALQAALLYSLVAYAAASPEQGETEILCKTRDDCTGKNAHCSGEKCTCSWGFKMVHGDCFLEDEYPDEDFIRSKRSPGSKVEKLEKKLLKAQIKEAKKHGVPVIHTVPVVHSIAHVPVVHVSRHRRSPGAVSKLERKIVKAQVKRVGKKQAKKLLRVARDSHQKKIEKLERKIVKEQIKQAKKDAKRGRYSHRIAPPPYGPVVYHQPVYTQTYTKSKSRSGPLGAVSRTVAKAKSYIG